MLARYRIVRGARPPDDPLPAGVRQDTRKHTQHLLRPSAELVTQFLSQPSPKGFSAFRAGYLALLEQRFREQRAAFDALAQLARQSEVYLGCNCPTAQQPDVRHCHTYLALGFMAKQYPGLDVRLP
ncbi:MAG TPA: hypothetical protein VJU61_04100 [Polyangiaceae bacterium]|nr:hypothetical protein [Polyangiaceae bacterium]